MNITLTSGLSTVCNSDTTPPTAPTIARSEVVPESPHYDKIALFCANICKTDSPQLRRLVIPLEHSNDPPVPTPSVAVWPPNNIHCRCPARGPILTNRQRQERVQWATARQHWRYQQWRRVLSSDESRFCISTGDGRVRVWRRRGLVNVTQMRVSWGGQSFMVWVAIWINHKPGPFLSEYWPRLR